MSAETSSMLAKKQLGQVIDLECPWEVRQGSPFLSHVKSLTENLCTATPHMDDRSLPTQTQYSLLMDLRPTRLPPELIDEIIKILRSHKDRAALGTCALVCRSWVPPGRRYLFKHVILHSWDAIDEFKRLCSTMCTFASAVQHLDFKSNAVLLYDSFDFVSKFQNVTQLSLRELRPYLLPSFPPRNLLDLLHRIETLQLDSIDFDRNGVLLLRLLRQCPRLQILSFVCVYLNTREPLNDADVRRFSMDQPGLMPVLKVLNVPYSCFMIPWLVTHWRSAVSRLTTLDLDVFSHAELSDSVEWLLETVGSSLQVLQLNMHHSVLCESPLDLNSWHLVLRVSIVAQYHLSHTFVRSSTFTHLHLHSTKTRAVPSLRFKP
jgi:hypothetical protein